MKTLITPANRLRLEIREAGRIATLTKARKPYHCSDCQEYILVGTYYYSVVIGGGGLGSIKFPDRIHIGCLDKYFERVKRNQERSSRSY